VVGSDSWEVNKLRQASPEGPGCSLFCWKGADREIIKNSANQIYERGPDKYPSDRTLLIYLHAPSKTIATPTVQWLMIVISTFPTCAGVLK
jgi:hypothetical protein